MNPVVLGLFPDDDSDPFGPVEKVACVCCGAAGWIFDGTTLATATSTLELVA